MSIRKMSERGISSAAFAPWSDLAASMPVGTRAILVLLKAFAERVAVDAERGGGFGVIVVVAIDHVEDEALFKLSDGFFKENSLANHLVNQFLKFSSHKLPRSKASPITLGHSIIKRLGYAARTQPCLITSSSAWPVRRR